MATLAGHRYMVHGSGDMVGLTVRFDVQDIGADIDDVADLVAAIAAWIGGVPGITSVTATRYDVVATDITPAQEE